MNDFGLIDSWREIFSDEFNKSYFIELQQSLKKERENYTIFPSKDKTFEAFNLCPFENTKVILIGQDPYHGDGQANGLSFSVSDGINTPPSLKNIFKELYADLGFQTPSHGNLDAWAKQGVLLLNSTLTVRKSEPTSHQKLGWEIFTDKVIQTLSEKKENLVFLLWGNFAQTKEKFIYSSKHLILKAAHPSPLARGAFFGSKPFSQTNLYLKQCKLKEIDWSLGSIHTEPDLFS